MCATNCGDELDGGTELVKIREMKDEEIREIAKIARDEIFGELSLEEMEDLLRKRGEYPYLQHFVAEENGIIVGFISWSFWDRWEKDIVLEILLLAVKREFQGKGIGRKLIEQSFRRVKAYWQEQGLNIVMFRTETDEANKNAQRFYEEVLKPSQKFLVPNVWGPNGGIVFYFKKL